MSRQRTLVFSSTLVLVIGLAIGAAAAFVLRGEVSVTGQTDPCFGGGELIGTHPYMVTEAVAASAAKYFETTGRFGVNLTPGEVRQASECRISQFETSSFDIETGALLSYVQDWGALIATVEAGETPVIPQDVKEHFVPSGLQQDQTATCDLSWLETTLTSKQARMCHPDGWTQQVEDEVSTWLGSEVVSVGVFASDYDPIAIDLRFDCQPELVTVRSGTAGVCASPVDTFGHQAFGVILPSGRKIGVNILKGAPQEDKQIAFRVAFNVEDAP